ncbi:MAG: hypothetical protein JKX84_09015 [Flavobacteriales bacterium]|nr:hypothetical protein [Flavobacteriales bacterium]
MLLDRVIFWDETYYAGITVVANRSGDFSLNPNSLDQEHVALKMKLRGLKWELEGLENTIWAYRNDMEMRDNEAAERLVPKIQLLKEKIELLNAQIAKLKKGNTGSELFVQSMRDCFPTNKVEADPFGVSMYDDLTVFKIYDADETVEMTQRLWEVVNRINHFLGKNGYEPIPYNEIDRDAEYNYDSPDGLVSLGKHGYNDSLVLFIKSHDY